MFKGARAQKEYLKNKSKIQDSGELSVLSSLDSAVVP